MWTAADAHLEDVPDAELIVYAHKKGAVLVTTNRDCALLAQSMELANAVWLKVTEDQALEAMKRAAGWFKDNRLPSGRVLRISRNRDPIVLVPKRR